MVSQKPGVSVCMATYNGEKYIAEQLASILPQLGEFDEIVISDNFSTDGTVNAVMGFGDSRIKINQFYERNIVLNFENAIKLAKGNLIFLADQDDIWLPNKLKIMCNYLQNSDLVLSDCNIVDQSLNLIFPSFLKHRNVKSGLLNNIFRNGYLGCCMGFRRSLLDFALPFPRSLPMHDWWLGLVAEIYGKVTVVEIPLLLYRRHGANASQTTQSSRTSFAKRLIWRLHLIRSLIFRAAQKKFL